MKQNYKLFTVRHTTQKERNGEIETVTEQQQIIQLHKIKVKRRENKMVQNSK